MLIADSCFCWLSLLSYLPKYDGEITYVWDYEKNPFWLRPQHEVVHIVEDWLSYAQKKNISQLLIPCNTASLAIKEKRESLSEKYNISIVTTIDAFQTMLNKVTFSGKVLLVWTKGTIASWVYQDLLEKAWVDADTLVGTHIESCIANWRIESWVMKEALIKDIQEAWDLSQSYDFVICGCSCFSYAKEVFAGQFKAPWEQVIDPIARFTPSWWNVQQEGWENTIRYCTTKLKEGIDMEKLVWAFLDKLSIQGGREVSLLKIR